MGHDTWLKCVRKWFGTPVQPRRCRQAVTRSMSAELRLLEPRVLLSASVPDDAAATDLWQPLAAFPVDAAARSVSYLNLTDYTAFSMNEPAVRRTLDDAAPETFSNDSARTSTITLLDPEGKPERFAIYESQIMAPELAAQFPSIKTYVGQGIDDPTAVAQLDLTPEGFHAQVLSEHGRWYIDPYFHLNDDFYASYYTSAARPSESTLASLRGAVNDIDDDTDLPHRHSDAEWVTPSEHSNTAARSGSVLRTYRTAIAATGEYTAFHGGTVELGQAAIVTAMNRVSGLFETEFSIRMQLIGNNSTLVYTNAATDPYTNDGGNVQDGENQANVDAVIGDANYDIGHVFGTGGGGSASLSGVGVSGDKAWAHTGQPSPTGDSFWVDYVCHEMGHQFGAEHTFNNPDPDNRVRTAAYEPGSGSTIMSYAGLFQPQNNLQATNDAYFHSYSFDQIINHVDNVIPNVGTRTNTGNTVPTINAGSDYTIPANTPFKLTAVGSDAGGGSLVYNWEERDLGPAQVLGAAQNTTSPIFRSWTPTSDPSRTFPRLEDILDGTLVKGEKIPSLTRTMNFRAIARDNFVGGGGVNTDDMVLNVVDTGAAFVITSQTSNVTWTSGTTENVTWNVAGTTANGINTANVRILLSTDGGLTYSTVLSSSTANDGTEAVLVPYLSTTQARIRVEAVGNVFFDISDVNFTVTGTNTPPSIGIAVANQTVNDNATISPFLTLTVSDPDTQAMSALVRIGNGVVRGDFTPASAAGWSRTVIGNDIQYARTFTGAANIGNVVQTAIRSLVFQPRSNAIKPLTTETTVFTVTVADALAAPVSNNITSVRTTSLNDAPTISGTSTAVTVNDNATVNPLAAVIVNDADMQEMLISVTILNGLVRGDFAPASTTGWAVRYTTGNDITYKRYFGPQTNVGAAAQAAFRALVFQPRQNAIRPTTTELTDFQVTVSDGVAPAVLGTNSRVTTTSVNNAPVIGGAVANQVMNDDQTKAVFSTLTVTDPDNQDTFTRVTITNGVVRGDFTAASATGWTRTVTGNDIIYTRYFNPTANIGSVVQMAIRALVFQPRNNVPIGTTEMTSFTVFVNDGVASATNSTTSVITTGVAPRVAATAQASATDWTVRETTIIIPATKKSHPIPLARLLRKSR